MCGGIYGRSFSVYSVCTYKSICIHEVEFGKHLFHTFMCNGQTCTLEVLWMTLCLLRLGHPQHLGGNSFDCCIERYKIVVLLPNSEQYKLSAVRCY